MTLNMGSSHHAQNSIWVRHWAFSFHKGAVQSLKRQAVDDVFLLAKMARDYGYCTGKLGF